MTNPSRVLKDIEDLLLRYRLIGGLWVSLGRWSEDGVDIRINKGNQLSVNRGSGLTELAINPVLKNKDKDSPGEKSKSQSMPSHFMF